MAGDLDGLKSSSSPILPDLEKMQYRWPGLFLLMGDGTIGIKKVRYKAVPTASFQSTSRQNASRVRLEAIKPQISLHRRRHLREAQ